MSTLNISNIKPVLLKALKIKGFDLSEIVVESSSMVKVNSVYLDGIWSLDEDNIHIHQDTCYFNRSQDKILVTTTYVLMGDELKQINRVEY